MNATDRRRRARSRIAARVAFVACIVVDVVSIRVAHAQTAEQNAAQALFDDGERLFREGRFDEACAKLRDSQRLDPAAGTLLNLARCYEAEGKLATAAAAYEQAIALARRTGRAPWASLGSRRLAALEPRVPHVTILVSDADVQTSITLDGGVVPPSAWGASVAIDPGKIHVEAHRPGKRAWVRDVDVAEGQHAEIDVGPLEADAAPAEVAREPPPADDAAPRRSPQRYAAIAATAVGAVGLAVGAGFGVVALADNARAASLCPAKRDCADDGAARAADDARRAATVSTVALVTGGAMLATGVVLFVTAPSGSRSAPPERAGWRFGVTPWGVSCEGAF